MKISFLLFFLLIFKISFSQEILNDTLTIEFTDLSKKQIIEKIENNSNYKFYFVSEWFDDTTLTRNYVKQPIKVILDDLFESSIINYFIHDDHKIILTQSILIDDTISKVFFSKDPVNAPPVAAEITNELIKPNIAYKRFGKESIASRGKTFRLSGNIKSSSSNRSLANLVIRNPSNNSSTLTNEQGEYAINLKAGVQSIQISGLGYSPLEQHLIIYQDAILNLQLDESAEALEEVIVEADADKNTKEVITGITKIDIEGIKNIPLVLGERDILKVATMLPGISNAGEGAWGYNVRGGKEDQNLILLDNAVLYNPSHFFGIFSAVNPFTTGEAEIYKGNIPAEFGGRLSSVFDIKTKKGNTEKLAGEGSIGPVTSNLALEVPFGNGKSSLIIGGRMQYSDWILRSLDEASLKNSSASFYDAILKVSHEINENNSIEATGYISHDSYSISSDSIQKYGNFLMSLQWNKTFNERNLGSLILSNSSYQYDIEYDGNTDTDFNLGYKVNETELKLKLKYLLNDKHTLDYGISSKLYNIQPGTRAPLGAGSIIELIEVPKEKALESAIFITDNFEVSEKLALNLGFRFSYFNAMGPIDKRVYAQDAPINDATLISSTPIAKNKTVASYNGPEVRASLRYLLGQDFSIKASYNLSNQYIHTLSNNTTVSPTATWKLTDFNIKPQQATQYSLGLHKNFNGNEIELSLEGYYKKSTNILDYKVGADLLINRTVETEVLQGEGKAYGAEFLVRKDKGRLNGWFGYTYSRSMVKFDSPFGEERVNNGAYFSSNYDKPHDLNLVANYRLTKRFSLSTSFTFQTGRPVTYPVGSYNFNGKEYVLYSERNKFRIPDYYRLDIGLNIEGNHKIKKLAHSFWNISVYNVLGRNNPYSVFFVNENGEIKGYQSSIFSIPVPTISYNFKF